MQFFLTSYKISGYLAISKTIQCIKQRNVRIFMQTRIRVCINIRTFLFTVDIRRMFY